MNSITQPTYNQLVKPWIEARVPFLKDALKPTYAPYKNQKAYDELILILQNYPDPLRELPVEMIPLLNAIGDPAKSWHGNVVSLTEQKDSALMEGSLKLEDYDKEIVAIFADGRKRAQKNLISALAHTNEILYNRVISTISYEKCEDTALRDIALLINELQKQILLNTSHEEYDPLDHLSKSYESLVLYFAKRDKISGDTHQKIIQLIEHLFAYYRILSEDKANGALITLITNNVYIPLMNRKKPNDFCTILEKTDIPDAIKKTFLVQKQESSI